MYTVQAEEKQGNRRAALITIFISLMIVGCLAAWNFTEDASANSITAQDPVTVFTELAGMSSSGASNDPAANATPHTKSSSTYGTTKGETPDEKLSQGETASTELDEALSAFSHSSGASNTNSHETVTGTEKNTKGTKQENVHLKDRIMIQAPEAVSDSQEEGKVVVAIVVDANGNVIKAEPGEPGSTTTSAVLYSKARKAAMTAKFNSKEDVQEQRGTITFVFVLK